MKLCVSCGTGCIDEARFCARCGSDVSAVRPQQGDPFIGITIADVFVLKEAIGEGGMGRVYRAEQAPIGRTVAVKILHQHLIGDETAAARFQTEARAASRMNHPNSIAVLDFGRTEAGLLYLAMEYLVGKSLDRVMREEGPLSLGRAVDIIIQVLLALEAAHDLGIIHRDMKPENVFVEPTRGGGDLVKVLDFGIAKFREEGKKVTQTGMVAGTPEYMSPEQARGDSLDARSDLYAVGVILYQLLTEQLPFSGRNAMEVMLKHLEEPPLPPSIRRPDREIPASLDEIVMRALAKSREDRVPSARETRHMLSEWLEATPLDVLLLGDEPGVQAGAIPTSLTTGFRTSANRAITTQHARKGLDTIGRSTERQILAELLAGRGPRAMWLTGPRGIGKSRLLEDLARTASARGFTSYWATPDPTRARDPLYPMRRLASAILGLTEEPQNTEEVKEAAQKLGLQPGDINGLGELYSLADFTSELTLEARRRELEISLRRLVGTVAGKSASLVLLDGVDRYDGASRQVVTNLLRYAADLGVFVVAAAADTLTPPVGVVTRQLAPLDTKSAAALASAAAPSLDKLDEIAAAAAGNPLWILHQAEVAAEGGPVRAGRVVDVLAARLEMLQPTERRVLQCLAVCGDEATGELIETLSGESDVNERLRALCDRGLVSENNGVYRFTDVLLGEVAHASLPAEIGRSLHLNLCHERRNASPVVRAHHAWLADLGPATIEAVDRAGCWAARRFDDEGASLWFYRGQELVRRLLARGGVAAGDLNRAVIDLARKQAEVLRRRGDRTTAEGVLGEALDVAVRPIDKLRLRADLGRIALEAGAPERALKHLRDARSSELPPEESSDWLDSVVLRTLGVSLLRAGDFDGARPYIDEGLRRIAGREGKDAPWEVLIEVAEAYLSAGQLERGRVLLKRALGAAEDGANPNGQLRALEGLGELAGMDNAAATSFEKALDIARRLGDRARVAALLVRSGRIYLHTGRLPEGAAVLHEGADLAESLGLAEVARMAFAELAVLRGGGFQAPPNA